MDELKSLEAETRESEWSSWRGKGRGWKGCTISLFTPAYIPEKNFTHYSKLLVEDKCKLCVPVTFSSYHTKNSSNTKGMKSSIVQRIVGRCHCSFYFSILSLIFSI